MLRDNELILSDGQAVTATAMSETLDLGAVGRPGVGQPIGFRVSVGDTDFETLTSMQVQILASDNSDMSSSVVVAESADTALADLTAKTLIFGGQQLPISEPKRYWAFNYVVTGSDATAGNVNAEFILDQPAQAYFDSPLGLNI